MVLSTWFKYKPDDQKILLFDLKTKRSIEFTDSVPEIDDLYYHVCTSNALPAPGTRWKASDLQFTYGLWLDVDLKIEGKKKNYPPNQASALELLREFPFKPTLIVNSGGGLHVYWRFNEPLPAWEHANTCMKFQHWVQSVFKSKGFELDSTGDIARILRVDGLTNTKYGVKVEIIELNDVDLNLSDANDLIQSAEPEKTPKKTITDDLILDSEADISARKLTRLCTEKPEFKATWEHRRKDFKDSSPSAYSFALAYYAHADGWTNQEIVDLIISFRREHGHDLKLKRIDWYRTVLENVATAVRDNRGETFVTEFPDEESNETRENAFELLSKYIEIEVTGMESHGSGEEIYVLKLVDGKEINIGTVEKLANFNQFALRCYEGVKRFPKDVTKKAWKTLLERIGPYITDVKHQDAERDYVTATAVIDFVYKGKSSKFGGDIARSKYMTIKKQEPYVEGDKVYLSVKGYAAFIAESHHTRIDEREFRRNLSAIGFKQVHVEAFEGQDRVQRRYWEGDLAALKSITQASAS